MSKGWHLVARLGGTAARYPHILVDAHGWCLRLGPRTRNDEKYFASLPVLLHGLVEHFIRRRMAALSSVLDMKDLVRELRDALHSALGLCQEALERGGLEAHIRRLEPRKQRSLAQVLAPAPPIGPGAGQEFSTPGSNRHAV